VSVALSAIVHKYDLFRWLKRPIDAGGTFRGRRIFGESKTWRGVAIALVGSVLAVACQKYVVGDAAAAFAVLDYTRVNPVILGSVIGVAAMAGELPNSFVKRQLGIAPGETSRTTVRRLGFWVWDQVDLLTLTWPALLPWLRPTPALVGASFLLVLVLHPLVAQLGFLIGARRTAR
jgi:CDP-2,3-bis-(O-geranylgeranyl)-sn-glycerol synthase